MQTEPSLIILHVCWLEEFSQTSVWLCTFQIPSVPFTNHMLLVVRVHP